MTVLNSQAMMGFRLSGQNEADENLFALLADKVGTKGDDDIFSLENPDIVERVHGLTDDYHGV